MKVLKSRVLLGSQQDEVGFVLLEYIWLVVNRSAELYRQIIPLANRPLASITPRLHHPWGVL